VDRLPIITKEKEIVSLVKAIVPKKLRNSVISTMSGTSVIGGLPSPKFMAPAAKKGTFIHGSKIQMNDKYEKQQQDSLSRLRN